ncbi:MAG TPA: hypothetical protein VFF77_00625 [Holophagaceae bacterium]|nr:hypothetical protein [Holophagaceae bacterium]
MATPRVCAALRALVFLAPAVLMAQGADDSVDAVKISALIQVIASKDHSQIARLIHYPLGRAYPVPPIKSESECLKRFDEVFDEALLADISRSDPKNDWERVGWRGIMLGNGEVWLDDDSKIIAINHETEKAKAVRAHLIDRQKQRLPAALRDFDEPVMEWSTKHFLIRVDLKGDDYRLLVFKGHSYAMPVHILSHGNHEFEGSGGNYHIDWESEGRTYRIYADDMSHEDSSYEEYDGPAGPLGLGDRRPVVKKRMHEQVK